MMRSLKTVIGAGLGAGLLFLGSGAATAETIDLTGTVTYNLGQPEPVADGYVNMKLWGRLKTASPSHPFNGSMQYCTGIFKVMSADEQNSRAGSCYTVDDDGDIWSLSWQSTGLESSVWSVLWGTGKYEGMSGSGATVAQGGEVYSWVGSFELK